MSEKRIQNSLQDLFLKNRIIFWYDADQEWKEAFEGFEGNGVVKLMVERAGKRRQGQAKDVRF